MLKCFVNFARHPFRQVDCAVRIVNNDWPDVLAIQSGFVGHGTHDISRLDAVFAANFDAITFHAGFRRTATTSFRTSAFGTTT